MPGNTTPSFADLDAHQALMDQLKKATEAAQDVTAAAQEVLEDLEKHNSDGQAHPDIRKELEGAGTATMDQVDERIGQHNSSLTAHPELMASINAALKDTASMRTLIDQLISAHNADTKAHSDIREYLNVVKTQLGTSNLTEIAEKLEQIDVLIDGTIKQQIIDLQSVDAKHDSLILKNASDIASLTSSVSELQADFETIGSISGSGQEGIDESKLSSTLQDLLNKLGYPQYVVNGPSLLDFKCSLPLYVGKNTVQKFTLSGAKGKNNNPVVYSITPGKGDAQYAPATNIAENQKVTMTVGNLGEPGDTIYFTVTVKDTISNIEVKTVCATMLARPLDTARVSCYGLPAKIEPGKQYKFSIRNIVNDANRFTYGLDPLSSHLLFDKFTNLQVGEEIVMTVPSSVGRDIDLTFQIVVYDKYSDTQNKDVVVHTNPIPGAEGFKSTVPAVVVPGTTINVRFSGIVSANGIPATFGIENGNNHLTFGKTTGILANENVSITISKDAERGQIYEFVVVSTDENNAQVRITQGFSINSLPSSNTVYTTLAASTVGGVTLEMQIHGGTDAEDGAGLTFNIDAAKSGFRFSKVAGISPTDTIFVSIPKVAEDLVKSFMITAVDALGEQSAKAKQIDILTKVVYVADTPYIVTPQEGNNVNPVFEMKWSEFSMHADMQQNMAIPTGY